MAKKKKNNRGLRSTLIVLSVVLGIILAALLAGTIYAESLLGKVNYVDPDAVQPTLSQEQVEELYNIPGSVPNPVNMPNDCYFKDRCEMQCEHCSGQYPPEIKISDTHYVSCYRYLEQGEVMGYPKSANVEEL